MNPPHATLSESEFTIVTVGTGVSFQILDTFFGENQFDRFKKLIQ